MVLFFHLHKISTTRRRSAYSPARPTSVWGGLSHPGPAPFRFRVAFRPGGAKHADREGLNALLLDVFADGERCRESQAADEFVEENSAENIARQLIQLLPC